MANNTATFHFMQTNRVCEKKNTKKQTTKNRSPTPKIGTQIKNNTMASTTVPDISQYQTRVDQAVQDLLRIATDSDEYVFFFEARLSIHSFFCLETNTGITQKRWKAWRSTRGSVARTRTHAPRAHAYVRTRTCLPSQATPNSPIHSIRGRAVLDVTPQVSMRVVVLFACLFVVLLVSACRAPLTYVFAFLLPGNVFCCLWHSDVQRMG